MRVRIQRWGNSLAVRIPKAFAEDAGIEQSSMVDLSLIDGNLVLKPMRPEYALADLLTGVTKANRHAEVEVGEPVGTEIW